LVFDNADTADGDVTPARTLAGAATSLGTVWGITVDSANDRLYTAGLGDAVLVFNNASTIDGNVAPSRSVTGASTTLSNPAGIWLDAASNRLYVGNYSADSILVYDNASTIDGNLAPSRTIAGAATTILNPGSLSLDTTSDRLYVANSLNNRILVFDNASTANGNVAPARTIAGASTTLSTPRWIWLDTASDQLYVSNFGSHAVIVFDSASTIDGDVAPSRTIAGATTTLYAPYGLVLNSVSNQLYVVSFSDNSILVFNNASTIDGNIAPSRTIIGTSTTLNRPRGIWLQ
jgi:DNA-binding beta-propeller fold protein YncE